MTRRKKAEKQTPISSPPGTDLPGTDSPGLDSPVLTAAQVPVKQMDKKEMSELIRSIIREELKVHMDELQPQLNSIKLDVKSCAEKVTGMETALSSQSDQINELERECGALRKICKTLQQDNQELREKTDRLEGYSRRFNIRVFGLDKGVEGDNATEYMSALLRDVFRGQRKLPGPPDVEIAHRVAGKGPGPRPMIVRLQRFVAKEAILKIAKLEKVLEYKDMKLKIFPDLTTETARRRALFNNIRGRLYRAGIQSGLIHPATLILTFNGEKKIFQKVSDAEKFFEEKIKPSLDAEED